MYSKSNVAQLAANATSVAIANLYDVTATAVGAMSILVMTCIAESATETSANSATSIM